ncbi:MAG TPA: hypothetical protein VGN83_24920 [Falsiroseomonas sp.]|jgi:hypothetical protein|nr:hypothetical protein [Falsiroseomonas sp.]
MRCVLALAGLVLAAACTPQQGARPSAPGGSGQGALEAQAARLPAELAGFTRGNAVWHEPERPGLGVTVDYAGPARAAVATVSLYDRAEELDAAVAEVIQLAGTRTAQTIAERERSTLPVPGGEPLQCARLEGSYGRQEVRTLLCLGAAAGRLVKVQVTAPLRPVVPVDPLPFVEGVTQAARGA